MILGYPDKPGNDYLGPGYDFLGRIVTFYGLIMTLWREISIDFTGISQLL